MDKIHKLLSTDVYHQFSAIILPRLHVDLCEIEAALINQGKSEYNNFNPCTLAITYFFTLIEHVILSTGLIIQELWDEKLQPHNFLLYIVQYKDVTSASDIDVGLNYFQQLIDNLGGINNVKHICSFNSHFL